MKPNIFTKYADHVQALKAVLLELIKNGPSYSFDSDYYKNFTPEAISLRFKNILDTIQ